MTQPRPWRPSREELAAAAGQTVPDLVAEDLAVLFVGINPGLYSGATGHHFARPGNRFWPALHGAGFTPRLISPFEEHELLRYGLGITNFVRRATATAAELREDELREGAARVVALVQKVRPRFVAFLGVSAYRVAFAAPDVNIGQQPERLDDAIVWLLPNPSGLNAHYQLPQLIERFAELRAAAFGS